MARPTGIPGYLHHKASGRAFVRINGNDIYLGFYGTKESKAEYDRIIKEWLANERQLIISQNQKETVTIDALCLAYLQHAQVYYRKNGKETTEVGKIKVACRLLHEHCGNLPAIEFTRQSLKTIREKAISFGWNRKTVNDRIGNVKRLFKWACEEENILPASIFQELQILSGLKKGRTVCPESKRVKPVPLDIYEKTLEFCPPIVADMARIQYLAGMRPGEICALRPCDLDCSGEVWLFIYQDHKTTHHDEDDEHVRTIMFGHRAQEILASYLKRAEGEPERYLFSPRDSVLLANLEKRRKRKTKVQHSQVSRAKKNPKVKPNERYGTASYRRAIQRAAIKAGVKRWSPNQLRHTRATEIRKKYGLEAAQIILGHVNADVTQIYAERDIQKGVEIMKEIG